MIVFYLDNRRIGQALTYKGAKALASRYHWKSGRIDAHYIKDVYGVGTIKAIHEVQGLKDLKALF